jgi:hypothetical protein
MKGMNVRDESKKAIKGMVMALMEFEKFQTREKICEKDWEELCFYLVEVGDLPTWSEISALKQTLYVWLKTKGKETKGERECTPLKAYA